MKKLTVFQNSKTSNFSMFANWVSAQELEFQTAKEWFEFYHRTNDSNGESTRCLRIKRTSAPAWGDDGGGRRYTMRMASNDFAKFAK